jgi:hypothetical protein
MKTMTNRPQMHAPHLEEPPLFRERFDLVATSGAPQLLRIFTRNTLRAWNTADMVDDAVLVGTELLTNALRACEVAASTYERVSKLVGVRLLGLRGSLVVEVWDRCPGLPVLRPPTLHATSGRGLVVVDELARRWGVYRMDHGKVVWAELAIHDRQAVTA